MAIDTSITNIDFEVLRTNTCKTLKVLDLSHWTSSDTYAAYISILTPGSTRPIIHIFQKDTINRFNTNNLELSDVTDYSTLGALPDGIYTITLQRCLDDTKIVTKYHLQDCQIRCQIARKLISVDLTCTPCRKELLKEIQDIMLFLDGAQAQTDLCNVNKAMEYYQRASTLLDRITDTNSTGCKNC